MSDWEVEAVYWRSKDFPEWARRRNCKPIRHNMLSKSRKWSADACIYVAGNADPIASVKYPLRDLQQNVIALHRFLQGYRGGFVFMSSAAVYEGHRGTVSVATCLHPRLPYAISKMASERYIAHFAENRSLDWATILRLYYGYGPYDRDSRLVPRIVQAGRSRDRTFVVTAPRGTLVDPLYAEDIAHAALSAARGLAKGETLDLCGGRPMYVADFAREAAAAGGWRLRIVSRPRREEVPLSFHSSPLPTRKRLGLSPFTPVTAGLPKYLRWLEEPA